MNLSAAYNLFVQLAYKEMLNLSLNPSGKEHISFLTNIKNSVIYQFDIWPVASMAISNSIDFIEQRNGFYPNYYKISGKDACQDWEIIELIENIIEIYNQDLFQVPVEEKNLKENINQVKEKLEIILPYNQWKEMGNVHVNNDLAFNINEDIALDIQFEDFKIDEIAKFSHRNENFQMAIFKGKLNINIKGAMAGDDIGIKMYKEMNPGTDFSKVFQEINIYQKLSKLINLSKNCFAKYYGTCRKIEEGKIVYYMVMEYKDSDLGTILSKNVEISDNFLKTMFMQLIRSFNQMHNLGIYHLDIKPSNILTDKYFKINFHNSTCA